LRSLGCLCDSGAATRSLALSAAFSICLSGCDLFSKAAPDGGAADGAADASKPDVEAKQEPGADAVNKAKVARFGDEKRIEGGAKSHPIKAASASLQLHVRREAVSDVHRVPRWPLKSCSKMWQTKMWRLSAGDSWEKEAWKVA